MGNKKQSKQSVDDSVGYVVIHDGKHLVLDDDKLQSNADLTVANKKAGIKAEDGVGGIPDHITMPFKWIRTAIGKPLGASVFTPEIIDLANMSIMFGASINITNEHGDGEALLFFHGLVQVLSGVDMNDVLICKVNVIPDGHIVTLGAIKPIIKLELEHNHYFKYVVNIGNGHSAEMQSMMRKEMDVYPDMSDHMRVVGDVVH